MVSVLEPYAGSVLSRRERESGRSPNFKFSYDVTPKVAGGLEYYGSVGPVTGFDAASQQQHQIFPAIDLNIAPQWEINFGLGVGLTGATDHLIAKMILGYRFNF